MNKFKRAYTKAKNLLQPHKNTLVLLFLAIIFFSFSIMLTYDSTHYLNYVAIFEGQLPTSSWDIVRGPVFPIIIRLSDIIFGKTGTGILICTFLFYLSFSFICYIICKDIAKHYNKPKRITAIVTAIIILNPLIFGYFHVMLTEFVAITVTMLNILLAYKWIFIDPKDKKTAISYLIYFIFITIFCWHLKQPYAIIVFAPLITALILSICKNHKRGNILYRVGTVLLSILFLIVSIFVWNNCILNLMQVDKTTNRDSSSMLGKQLLLTYQIPYESDNANQSIPVKKAIPIFASNFFSNPGKIIGTYLKNYCGLTSICKITSENQVDYIATSELDLLNTYENTSIGYATYQLKNNSLYAVEDINDNTLEYASNYSTPISHNIFTPIMKALRYPTNILFKLAMILCLPALIILIIVKAKTKTKKYDSLFYISITLLTTASLHLLISAAAALIIDRYAIEAFAPSILGILGTFTYVKLVRNTNKTKITTTRH